MDKENIVKLLHALYNTTLEDAITGCKAFVDESQDEEKSSDVAEILRKMSATIIALLP